MARIANPFRYQFRTHYPSQMSVYKLFFGKKFLVVMCKALHQSVNQVAKEIDQRLRNGTKGPDDFYLKTVAHIRRARVTIMEVEMLCQPETELELLICHFKALQAAKKNDLSLNTSFEVKVPQWVPLEVTEAFNKWVSAQTKKPVKRTAKNHHRNATKKAAVKKGSVKAKQARNTKVGTKGSGGRKTGVRYGKR